MLFSPGARKIYGPTLLLIMGNVLSWKNTQPVGFIVGLKIMELDEFRIKSQLHEDELDEFIRNLASP